MLLLEETLPFLITLVKAQIYMIWRTKTEIRLSITLLNMEEFPSSKKFAHRPLPSLSTTRKDGPLLILQQLREISQLFKFFIIQVMTYSQGIFLSGLHFIMHSNINIKQLLTILRVIIEFILVSMKVLLQFSIWQLQQMIQ
ncbi:hypothetical protein TRFO_08203 [Tritrichomonas foetus]|uniref:Uncharacterized protein n=1 Tax=Tritrichomonas foetus TaxID=1144522 RepID=A0A1J4JLC2_9EUKA|nr:hypothetical protein TRFO_08203 [Tritrichomonas foetus]|eukprot:OHS99894.1 hypothetical protein TRFO_08203 [Tritrichomonas foetus]